MVALLAMVMGLTGCKVLHHTKSHIHGEHPQSDGPAYNIPPAAMLMHPGPGVDGPGPGVLAAEPPVAGVARASQVNFVGPAQMVVTWSASAPGMFDGEPLVCPGHYDFPQGAIYRLRLSNIPGRPGVELYPTLEVGPTMPRTDAYLAHNSIPVQFTEEDFDQVLSGNFVTKVIYLPDPEFQELAIAGVETLVSTRLDPGVDPIVEADRRGAIMAIVRIGNKDLQMGGGAVEGVTPATFLGGQPMPGYVSGVTTAQYGMPYVGTPIGLPGPPHIPLGGPAGLKLHTISDHTKHHIPGPVHRFDIHVKQEPGFRYPQPVNKIHINEQAMPNAPVKVPCNCGPVCDANCPNHVGY
jgi:hypothetical protein